MKRVLVWTLLLAIAGPCESAERSHSASEPSFSAPMHHLDFDHPTVTVPITQANAAQAKFVEVRIEHIENPSLAALSFTVAYQAGNGEPVVLGSFSPYPPDHAGTFIVPTQKKVQDSGSILVTVASPDRGSRIRVDIAAIALVSTPSKLHDETAKTPK
jgi:hypothetical protein